MTEFYSRCRVDPFDETQAQKLVDHLMETSALAGEFAAAFQSEEWGSLAGLWHDLGKFLLEFMRKLRGEALRVEHSGAGAGLAMEKIPGIGEPLAFAIAGHHAGLANLIASDSNQPSPLRRRIDSNRAVLEKIRSSIPPSILDRPTPRLPDFLQASPGMSRPAKKTLRLSREFWIRFLFSALVDADRLNSEAFSSPEAADKRGAHEPLSDLRKRLDDHIDEFVARLTPDVRRHPVNLARARVLEACRRSAVDAPGFFTLTVPTGGGKTLSALSFALNHAVRHGLRRVIVVIPYTSIIEQNAAVYRAALGAENVIEHHSNLDPEHLKNLMDEHVAERHELAAENWDAPVIVTTTVQFFESLFSNRPSRCRKLHNIARSVIILDEVQALPARYLVSILDALGELVRHYDCSVVLSTATPPALAKRDSLQQGIENPRHIISEPQTLAGDLERVRYEWPDPEAAAVPWEDLARELSFHQRVMAVVHRREDARTLARLLETLLPEETVLHLSARMCPRHRSDTLKKIKEHLDRDRPCRLVSTQLVEAGVDLDFPVVYRALAGLDSIVQAAGRCNREGRLSERGRVVIFIAPTPPPAGILENAMNEVRGMLREPGPRPDPNDPELFETYFRRLYMGQALDGANIQALRMDFSFATTADRFNLIEDKHSRTVIAPYSSDVDALLTRLKDQGPSKHIFRRLQPYTVQIPAHHYQGMLAQGALDEAAPGVMTIHPAYRRYYDDKYGLQPEDDYLPQPERLVL